MTSKVFGRTAEVEGDAEDRLLEDSGEGEDLRHTPSPSTSDTSNMSEKLNQSLVFSSQKNMKNDFDKVPLWRKVAYAVGAMPYAMCTTVLGFYFNIFLLEVVILDPVYVLIILFSGRVWDAITDPIVGYLASLTNTRFGRLRPWLAMSMVPSGVLYFFLFYVPPLDDYPQYWKYIYYQIVYLLYEASLSCIHVPYTALTVHMSNDSKERDIVTLIRMCFEVMSTLIGIGIYTLFYTIFVVGGVEDDCDAEVRVPSQSQRAAFQWHALFLGCLTVVFVSITVIFVREQEDEMRVNKRIGFFRGLKDTWCFRPYLLLVMVTILGWLALQFIQGNTALYIKYTLGLQREYTYIIIVLILSTICCMVFWQFIIAKFGKKTAFVWGMWSLFPILLSQLFLDRLPRMAYVSNMLAGFGVASAYLLPWSMLPDVIDESILKYSVRREELFYAYFVFGNKFGGGFTLAASTAILKIVGYDEMKCEQTWLIPLTMKLIVTIPPILFLLVALPFLWKYPITEKTRERVRNLLMDRRKRRTSDANGDARFNGPTSIAAAQHETASLGEENHGSPLLHNKTLTQSYF